MISSPRHGRGDRYSLVSLFSGAGGFDVGVASSADFDLKAAVEIEPVFVETLRLNRDKGVLGSQQTKIYCEDISAMDPHELLRDLDMQPGELDVLIGGPPCQTFSTAGRRAGPNDPRGLLIWDFLRFVDVLRPKVFVMENVRGLLSAALTHRPIKERPVNGGRPLSRLEEPGSMFAAWTADALAIADGEYAIDTFEVNAVNYGAPQLRERVLVFGNRLQRHTPHLEPTHSQHDPDLAPFRTLGDALRGFRERHPAVVDFSPRKKAYLDLVPPGGNWRSLPPEVAAESMGRAFFAKGGRSGWWRRLSWDLPSPTITTLPNHSSTSLCHPTETRAISVGEAARIQEFPDDWQFCGTTAEQMKQVGNAVPVRLGAVAGTAAVDMLEGRAASRGTDEARVTRSYVKSHVRTRRWWHEGRAVIHGAAEVG